MPPDDSVQSIRSVDRAIDLLYVLETVPHPMGVSELGRAVNLPRATALRLLSVLVRRGLVEKVQGRYQIGVGVVPMAHAFLLGNNLSRAALPVLQELAAASGATVSLFVRLGFHRVVVQRVEGLQPLRYVMPIGQRLPLHVGAGKVLAAAMSPEQLQQMLDGLGEMRLATGQILTRDALLAELQKVRHQGFAVSRNERTMGVVSVSAPVVGPDGSTLAAVAVIGPINTITDERIEQLSLEVRQAAQAISGRYCRF
ncbi:MAG: IclR family transcriptional regulator [Sphingomonadaceae bacterium]